MLLGLVAFGGHEAMFSNDKGNRLSGVDSEVKRLPFRGALSVSVTLLVRPCQRKNPGGTVGGPSLFGKDSVCLVRCPSAIGGKNLSCGVSGSI